MLKPGVNSLPSLWSASSVLHAVSGRGTSIFNGLCHTLGLKDTFSALVLAAIEHTASRGETAFLVRIYAMPVQEKLGGYEERAR